MTFVLFILSCAFEFLCGYMVGTNLERKRIGKQMKRGYIVMEGSLYFCNNPPIKISTEVEEEQLLAAVGENEEETGI